MIDLRRRQLLIGLGLLAAAGSVNADRLLPTPRQTLGPFYPVEPPLNRDNDLTVAPGRSGLARGQHSEVRGRLLDTNGQPLKGLRVEIWQCDATGRYHHPRDRGGEIDENFQGFGHTVTDVEGRYRFRTIRPVPYPGRTPHIHFAVFAGNSRAFATQLYVRGEPRNDTDFLFKSIPPEQRQFVLAAFKPHEDGLLHAHLDIVLGATPQG